METPPLSVTEETEQLLREAAGKTGKTEEEILRFCLEHGIHKILEGAETKINQS
jgi:predicted DNA-binding protein